MNNQMNVGGYPQAYPQSKPGLLAGVAPENRNLLYGFLGCLVVIVIGCFFPYAVQKATDISMNYISYDGDIKDGVFIIGLSIVAAVMAIKNKAIVSLIMQGIGGAIFIVDWLDTTDKMKELNEYAGILGDNWKLSWGIGFYIVLIGLVGSIVTAFLLWKKTKGGAKAPTVPFPQGTPAVMNQPMNQPMNPAPMPVPPTPTCPYCGTTVTSSTGFCPNCGAKINS